MSPPSIVKFEPVMLAAAAALIFKVDGVEKLAATRVNSDFLAVAPITQVLAAPQGLIFQTVPVLALAAVPLMAVTFMFFAAMLTKEVLVALSK